MVIIEYKSQSAPNYPAWKMIKKIARKFFPVFVSLLMLVQPLTPVAGFVSNAYAQEAPLPTSEPSASPDPSPVPSPDPGPSPSVAPTTTTEPSPLPSTGGNLEGEILNNTSAASAKEVIQTEDLSAQEIQNSDPSVITDKADYAPTDAVVITGTNFSANTTYTIYITSVDNYSFTATVTTNDQGSFTYVYQLDGTTRPLYTVEIKDASGNVVATTTFTDPPPPPSPGPAKFAQCANKNPTAGACDWIGSILQASNSVYFEGMSVPQRIFDGGFGNGAHTVAFSYSYTKGGIHAYDFITSKNQGNGSFTPGIITFNNCQGLTGANLTSCTALIGTTEHLVAIPPDTFKSKDSNDGDALVGTGTTQSAKETAYETANGPRKISVYTNASTFTVESVSPIVHSVATDGDTGDSDATLTLNFTLAGCPNGPGDPGCDVLIYFDGHLAVGGTDNTTGVNWGPGLGSANISGGPYHIKDVNLDGGGGSLDNQIQGASILVSQGTIELKKVWSGTGGQTTLNIGTTAGASDVDTQLTGAAGAAPLTTGQNTVNAGTYFVSETGGLTNYDSSLSCFNDLNNNGANDSEPTVTVGGSNSVAVASGDHVICTFTNTRQQGTIELKKVWSGTGGQTTLKIGTSVGGSEVDSQLTGADGAAPLTTGQNTVNTGTYNVSETGGLTNYSSGLSCFNDANNNGTNDGESTVTPDGSNNVAITTGQHVICTFTNTRNTGTIELKKVWSGTGGQTTLNIGTSIGGSQVDTQLTGAAGVAPLTTGQNTVDTGTYNVSETGGLTNYDSSLSCFNDANNNGSNDSEAAVTPDGSNSVAVTTGQHVICTFTNTRHTGTVELKKVWSGTGGQTTLNIGTSNGGSQVDTQLTGVAGAAPLTTGQNTVDTGTYFNSETGGLTDYTTGALSCFNDANNNGSNDSEAAVTVGANDSVPVGSGDHVICTYTNTRQQGKIELQKDFVGTPEDVTVKIGTSQNGTQVDSDVLSADGTDGEHTVDTGTYFVSEVLTTPANYTTGLTCYNDLDNSNTVNGGDTVHAVNTGTGETAVGNNEDVLCVYTNTRNTGTVELKKHWVGTAGSTTLNIGTTVGDDDVDTQAVSGSDDTTGQNTVDTGTFYMSEVGGLTNYDSAALSCFNDANDNGTNDSEPAVTVGGSDSIAVGNGEHVICTYTNTRQQGTIELQKDWVGTAGNTTLSIGTTAGDDDVDSQSANGIDASTGANTVDTGTYFVSETDPGSDYDTTLSCTDQDGAVTVGVDNAVEVEDDDTVVCVFTNTRQTGTVELKKHWVGTAGSTTLNIGTTAGDDDVDTQAISGSDGTTGQNTVDTGTFYMSEVGGLADYTAAALSCFNDTNNNGTNDSESTVTVGASDSVAVGNGEHVICTYTNTRQQGKIELQKDFVGTPEDVTVKIGTSQNGTQVDSDVLLADGTDGEHTVDTNTYFVSEVLTTPANYDTSLECFNDVDDSDTINGGDTSHTVNTDTGAVSVGNNDDVICRFTNTRHTGTIELTKVWSGTGGQTTLQIGTSIAGTQTDTQLTGAAGAAPLTTGQNTVDTGTYFNSETGGLTDYTTGALSCFNDANNNGTNDSEAAVTVGANDSVVVTTGQHVICTYTNTRNQGTIVIIKNSHGGPDAFGFSIAGPTPSTPTINTIGSPNGTGTTGNITVDTGAYTVNEGTPPTNWTLTDASCTAGSGTDTNADGILDTWNFNVTNGGTVTCTFTNSKALTTRTQGFWATHTGLANGVWAGVSAADASLCSTAITATATTGANQLMGGFWANVANKISPKAPRTDLEKARMAMLQQYLAAVLNFYQFGSGSPTLFSTARTAYCATNVAAIKTQTGILGAFNESGDSGVFTPGSSATPGVSKLQANIPFWNATTH